MTTAHEILLTQKWLTDIVIGYGLCPFASKVYDEGQVDFSAIEFSYQSLLDEMNESIDRIIDDNNHTSTKLIIIKKGLEDFNAYLDVYYALVEELERTELSKVVQLASFHPLYVFKDKQSDEVSNYSNRSPYPIIHILKVADVTAAIESHPDIHSVGPKNIALLEQKGLAVIKQLWKANGFVR